MKRTRWRLGVLHDYTRKAYLDDGVNNYTKNVLVSMQGIEKCGLFRHVELRLSAAPLAWKEA